MTSKIGLLMRASGLSLISFLVRIAIVFVLTPRILGALGMHWYGLWTVIVATVGHFTLVDIGLSGATQQYMTLAIERKDHDEAARVLSTSLTLYIGIGALILLASLGIAASAGFFFASGAERFAFRMCFLICAADLALALPGQAIQGAIYANLRGDLLAWLEIGQNLLRAALIILSLQFGGSIIGLAAAQLGTSLVIWPLHILVLLRLCPWLKARRPAFDRAFVRRMYGYGVWNFVTVIAREIRLRVDNVVLAGFRGLAAVPVFSFASTLTEYYIDVTYRAMHQLSTVFAQYHARSDAENLREKFLIASRISALVSTLLGGAMLVFGKQFLVLWVGPQLAQSYGPLLLLGGSMTLAMVLQPGWELLRAIHRHRNFALLCLAELAAKIALSLALVGPLGPTGVALATAIPLTLTSLGYLSWVPCRLIGVPLKLYAFEVARVFVPAVLAQLAVFFVLRAHTFTNLFELIAVAAAIYAPLGLGLALALLRPLERNMLFGEASRLLRRRKRLAGQK